MTDSSLVLVDGSLASLVALAIASARLGPEASARLCYAVAPLDAERELSTAAREAATRQGSIFAAERVDLPDLPEVEGGVAVSVRLLLAAHAGAERGCTRLVWPLHVGSALESDRALDVAAAGIDRAILAARLACLDAAGSVPDVRVDTPLIDLSDAQLADLALDLDAPVEACWFLRVSDDAAKRERARWAPLLRAAGWTDRPAPEPATA